MRIPACVAAAVTLSAVLCAAPAAGAEPAPLPPAVADGAPPPNGAIAAAAPGVLSTPDGWELTVAGADKTRVAVAPLTTALTSREYLVGGTFTGTVAGAGSTTLSGGSLVVGYRIGCGIIGGPVELLGSVGATPTFGSNAVIGAVQFPVNGQIKVNLRPGTVTTVPVGQKDYKGDEVRVTVTGFRVRVDGCVGQSFIQSYATFKSSSTDTDDIVTYAGQVTVV
jgi:hypothetical protein